MQDLAGHADPRTTRGYDDTNNRFAASPVTTLTAILAAHRTPPGSAQEADHDARDRRDH